MNAASFVKEAPVHLKIESGNHQLAIVKSAAPEIVPIQLYGLAIKPNISHIRPL